MSWSRAQGSQGHKPLQVFTVRNVCLIRQHSPFSENLPLAADVWGLTDWLACLNRLPISCGYKTGWEMQSLLYFYPVTFLDRPPSDSPLPGGCVPAHRCQGTAQRSSMCQQHRAWWKAGQAENVKGIIWQNDTPSAGHERKIMLPGAGNEFCSHTALPHKDLSPQPQKPFPGSGNKV